MNEPLTVKRWTDMWRKAAEPQPEPPAPAPPAGAEDFHAELTLEQREAETERFRQAEVARLARHPQPEPVAADLIDVSEEASKHGWRIPVYLDAATSKFLFAIHTCSEYRQNEVLACFLRIARAIAESNGFEGSFFPGARTGELASRQDWHFMIRTDARPGSPGLRAERLDGTPYIGSFRGVAALNPPHVEIRFESEG
jgi:hypothetical protein